MAVQETASQLSMALKVQEYPTLKVNSSLKRHLLTARRLLRAHRTPCSILPRKRRLFLPLIADLAAAAGRLTLAGLAQVVPRIRQISPFDSKMDNFESLLDKRRVERGQLAVCCRFTPLLTVQMWWPSGWLKVFVKEFYGVADKTTLNKASWHLTSIMSGHMKKFSGRPILDLLSV